MIKTDGSNKYNILSILVKSMLVLPHGNSSVERGFSENSHVVTEGRSQLDEESVSAIRTVKDAVKFHGGVALVPISKELLDSTKFAHRTYSTKLVAKKAEELKEKELEKQNAEKDSAILAKQQDKERIQKETQQSLIAKEKSLYDKEKDAKQEFSASQDLIKEGTKKLQESVKSKDMKGVNVAQMMVTTGHKRSVIAQSKLDEIRQEQKIIETRKRKMINNLIGEVDQREKSVLENNTVTVIY